MMSSELSTLHERAYALALRADVRGALAVVQRLALDDPVRRRFEQRFGSTSGVEQAEPESPTVERLLAVYQRYWHSALRGRLDAETELLANLQAVSGFDEPTLDALEPRLVTELLRDGVHALFGVTTPLREMMAWLREERQLFTVELVDESCRVAVVLLDDFVSLGWAHFATFGRYYTGGWVRPEALYCVRSAYDLESERFKVNYLAHEAQHQCDKKRFPGLRQFELEYRAKLTEVALAGEHNSAELVRSFSVRAAPDPGAAPHAFAEHCVVRDLTELLQPPDGDWFGQNPAALKQGAADLLRQSTRELVKRGPDVVS